MEGPIPVSALIHAATMVTAGIFLCYRCSPLLVFCPLVLALMVSAGSFTAFFAATSALAQNDIKKVIALSTCSQLGYLTWSAGMALWSQSLFHLANHAAFKALLFLAAGSVIHAVKIEQDLRHMGSLATHLPLTYAVLLIASLSLCGLPFTAGCDSKDAILELGACSYSVWSRASFILATLTALATAAYSTRLVFLAMLSSPAYSSSTLRASASFDAMLLSTMSYQLCLAFGFVLLAVMSLAIGWLLKPVLVGLASPALASALADVPALGHIDAEYTSLSLKVAPAALSLAGIALAALVHCSWHVNLFGFAVFSFVLSGLANRWHVDSLIVHTLLVPALNVADRCTYHVVDKGVVECLGPSGAVA